MATASYTCKSFSLGIPNLGGSCKWKIQFLTILSLCVVVSMADPKYPVSYSFKDTLRESSDTSGSVKFKSFNGIENVKNDGITSKSTLQNYRFKALDRILVRLNMTTTSPPATNFLNFQKNFARPASGSGSILGKVEKHDDFTASPRYQLPSRNSNKIDSNVFEEDSDEYDDEQQFDEDGDDDDDSLEDEVEYDDFGNPSKRREKDFLLDDRMSLWAHNYRQRYLSQRQKSPPPTTTLKTTTTSTTTTTTTAAPPSLSYSQWKWQHLGTRQGLEQYRRHQQQQTNSDLSNSVYNKPTNRYPVRSNVQHGSNKARPVTAPVPVTPHTQPQTPHSVISEAVQHAMKVTREGSCGVPRPRLVRVQDFYPHPGKTYVPHCTILHQCADDTGCCKHDVLTCSPKTTQRVELTFYTISLDHTRRPTVERLVFYNHTECECRDKLDEMMPRDESSGLPTRSQISYSSAKANSPLAKLNTFDSFDLSCKCPLSFSVRPLADGSQCSCDCFDKDRECLRLKRGKEFFSAEDKWCIESGRCEVPECAYGPYIHLTGRCTRKREKSGQNASWTRYLTLSSSGQ